MISTAQDTLQHVILDPVVDETLTQLADMTGLPRETVTKIVASGLPLMASVADGDPVVFKAMYAQSVKYLPPPTETFYRKLGKNAKARQAMADAFQSLYGPMTETIYRDAASLASATEEQTRRVLAAAMPVMVKAVGRANTRVNEMGFGRQLRNLSASAGSERTH